MKKEDGSQSMMEKLKSLVDQVLILFRYVLYKGIPTCNLY